MYAQQRIPLTDYTNQHKETKIHYMGLAEAKL